jgi:hypothetical protein
MKKLGLALAAILGLTVLTPATAEAGGCRTRVTYESCGTRLNWEYRFMGHDCHGRPVFQWVVVSRCAPPRHHGSYYDGGHYHSGYHGGYSGGYSSHYPRYTYPGSSCSPGRGRSGISFHYSR